MKKADYIFHRDKKEQIQRLSKENEPFIWGYKASNQPIFIPKRKTKKK